MITGSIHVTGLFLFFFFKWTYIDMERKCRENTLGQTATNSFRMWSLHFNQEKEEREDNNRALWTLCKIWTPNLQRISDAEWCKDEVEKFELYYNVEPEKERVPKQQQMRQCLILMNQVALRPVKESKRFNQGKVRRVSPQRGKHEKSSCWEHFNQ